MSIASHSIIASVCVPVCTHFEALHFYPPASYVSVAEAHSCWYKPISHFHVIRIVYAFVSVCVPVCTHFEALLFYPSASYVSEAAAHSCWYKPKSHFHVICIAFTIASV